MPSIRRQYWQVTTWAIWLTLIGLAMVLIAQPLTTLKSRQSGMTSNEVIDVHIGPLVEPVSQRIQFVDSHVTGLQFRVIAQSPTLHPVRIALRLFNPNGDLVAESLAIVESSSASQSVSFDFAPLKRGVRYRAEVVALDPDGHLQVATSLRDRFQSGSMSFPSNPVDSSGISRVEDLDLYFTSTVDVTFTEHLANQILAGSANHITSLLSSAIVALGAVLGFCQWAIRGAGQRLHIAVVGMLAAIISGTLLATSAGLPLGDTGFRDSPLGIVVAVLAEPFGPGICAIVILAAWKHSFRIALALAAFTIGGAAVAGEVLIQSATSEGTTTLWTSVLAFAVVTVAFSLVNLRLGRREATLLRALDSQRQALGQSHNLREESRLRAGRRLVLALLRTSRGRSALGRQVVAACGESAATLLGILVVVLFTSGTEATLLVINSWWVPILGLTALIAAHRSRIWLRVILSTFAIGATKNAGLSLDTVVERGYELNYTQHPYPEPSRLSSKTRAARAALVIGTALLLASALVLWSDLPTALGELSFWAGITGVTISFILRLRPRVRPADLTRHLSQWVSQVPPAISRLTLCPPAISRLTLRPPAISRPTLRLPAISRLTPWPAQFSLLVGTTFLAISAFAPWIASYLAQQGAQISHQVALSELIFWIGICSVVISRAPWPRKPEPTQSRSDDGNTAASEDMAANSDRH